MTEVPASGQSIYIEADSLPWRRSPYAGVTWKTDWIMEFTRTRAASEVTQDELFATDWNAGALSPRQEARGLDWLLGSWTGTQEDLVTQTQRDDQA